MMQEITTTQALALGLHTITGLFLALIYFRSVKIHKEVET